MSRILHFYILGSIVGFTDLGDIESHLSAFEKSVEQGEAARTPLANSMLVVMVKGLFTQLEFPYCQFPCTALSGDQMYHPLWEAVGRLELCGFKVLGLTCDGLAANRRLFRLHDPSIKPSMFIHKVNNPYTDEDRPFLFFSDPPHLIKTVRNCWASKCRLLWVSQLCIVFKPGVCPQVCGNVPGLLKFISERSWF